MMFTDNIFSRALSILFSYDCSWHFKYPVWRFEYGVALQLIEDDLGRLSAADLVGRYSSHNDRPDDDLLNIVRPSHLLASVA